MVDKFGTSVGRPKGKLAIVDDLELNFHRILNLKDPEARTDAATRGWVDDQLKRWITEQTKEFDDLRSKYNRSLMQVKAMLRTLDDSIKDLEKEVWEKVDKADCVSTNGGKMNVDLDIQNHAIRNLPEGARADEPVTKDGMRKTGET